MTEIPDEIAYGTDEVENCECPAVLAGFAPESADETTKIASTYDKVVRRRGWGDGWGSISKEKAKKAWLGAIDRAKEKNLKQQVSAGKMVAEELGWEYGSETGGEEEQAG